MTTDTSIYIVFGVVTLLVLIPTIIAMFRRNWLQALVSFICVLISMLGAYALSIALASMVQANLLDTLSSFDDATIQEISQYLHSDSDAVKTLLSLVSALVAPLLFWVYFLAFRLVLWIVYLILNAALLKKKNPESDKGKSTSRAVACILSLGHGYLMLSMLFMPFSYYANVANVCFSSDIVSANIAEDDTTTRQVMEYVSAYDSNIFTTLYYYPGQLFAEPLTQVTDGEETMTVKDIVPMTLDIVSSLSNVAADESGNYDVTALIETSAKVEKVPLIDKFMGSLLSDAGTSWKSGESFLTIAPLKISEEKEELNSAVYDILINNDKASTELKAVSALLATYQCMNGSSENSAQDLANAIANLDEDSMQIIKDTTSGTVISAISDDITEEQAEMLSDVISDVFDGLYDMVPGDDATQEEIDAYNEEVAKLDDLISFAGSGDVTDEDALNQVVEDIITSDVILDAVANNATEENVDNLLSSVGAETPEGTADMVYSVIQSAKEEDSEERTAQMDDISDAISEMSKDDTDSGAALKSICLSSIMTASSLMMINDDSKKDSFYSSVGISDYTLAQDITKDSLTSLSVSNSDPTKSDTEKETARTNVGDALSAVVNSIKGGNSDKDTLLSLATDSDIVTAAINSNC